MRVKKSQINNFIPYWVLDTKRYDII